MYRRTLHSFLPLVFFVFFSFAHAEGTAVSPMTMTLTPPYFNVSLAPGATWSSLLKFSNGSLYPLTMHLRAQNFRGNGGSGIEFFSRSQELSTLPYELATWITLPSGKITIPSGGTAQIPFTIKVPEDAEPGGHYAGIIIEGDEREASVPGGVGVSSGVSSLLLVRVAGDVVESGFIRDFTTTRFVTQSQAEEFELEFKNTGNVHIDPIGEVVITNMFGQVRGRIILEEQNSFGNILPFSTKKFAFSWNGERNYLDIGLYRARATLYYGEEGEKVAYHSAYFLVFPWMPALGIIAFLAVFSRIIRIGLRRYIRRALALERERLGTRPPELSVKILEGPLVVGARDFLAIKKGNVGGKHHGVGSKKQTYIGFLRAYQSFFLYIIVIIIGFGAVGFYFYQVFASERAYQTSILRGEKTTLATEGVQE